MLRWHRCWWSWSDYRDGFSWSRMSLPKRWLLHVLWHSGRRQIWIGPVMECWWESFLHMSPFRLWCLEVVNYAETTALASQKFWTAIFARLPRSMILHSWDFSLTCVSCWRYEPSFAYEEQRPHHPWKDSGSIGPGSILTFMSDIAFHKVVYSGRLRVRTSWSRWMMLETIASLPVSTRFPV